MLLHNNDLHLTNNDLTCYTLITVEGKGGGGRQLLVILYYIEKKRKTNCSPKSVRILFPMVSEKRIENTLKFQDENFSTYVGCRFHK